MKKENIEYKIAKLVDEQGGETYYVGGYVRDTLLGKESKDKDIEVHGLSPKTLFDILSNVGKPLTYGASFGIFSLEGENIDIALPRKEQNTGKGHRDFDIYVDPYIGTKKAAQRRDFTINAIMMNVLNDEIIDHFNGLKDLKKNIIRHIDDRSFIEDPLRVLRACQFAARFNFKIAKSTNSLCKTIDISAISKERVEEELKKALLQSNKPSIFFETLRKMNQLTFWFKELEELIGLKQDKIYHPEGDVYTHTMMVLDEASKYRDKVKEPYNFMLLALCHDLGKITTSFTKDGRIHSYGHENEIELTKSLLKRFTNNKKTIRYVTNMVKLHMLPNMCARNNSSLKTTNKMFDDAIAKEDLIYFALCDHVCKEEVDLRKEFLLDRYEKYLDIISKDTVTGDDLLKAGIKPNENFKEILAFAHKLFLTGLNKSDCLSQTIAYARKFNN